MSNNDFTGFCKKHFFIKAELSLSVFKTGLTFKSFFFEQDALILNDRISFVPKK